MAGSCEDGNRTWHLYRRHHVVIYKSRDPQPPGNLGACRGVALPSYLLNKTWVSITCRDCLEQVLLLPSDVGLLSVTSVSYTSVLHSCQ
jgi:hypothetical protein